MTALDDLCKKRQKTQLEWAILVTLEAGGEATAADAAEELVTLRRVAEAASGVVDNEDAFGYPSLAYIKKLEEALSKCRAA